MPRFTVHATVVGGKYLGEYEADSEEQAIEMALEENGHVSLCHQCSGECEDAEITETNAELVGE